MTRMNDPAAVRTQYACEDNLRAGEELLRRHFTAVKRIDVDGVVTVRDRAKLVAYRDSLSVVTEPVPDDVGLPFAVHCASAVLVATK